MIWWTRFTTKYYRKNMHGCRWWDVDHHGSWTKGSWDGIQGQRGCEDVYYAYDQNPLLCTLKIKISTASKCPISEHTWQEISQGSRNMTSRNRMKFMRAQLGPEWQPGRYRMTNSAFPSSRDWSILSPKWGELRADYPGDFTIVLLVSGYLTLKATQVLGRGEYNR